MNETRMQELKVKLFGRFGEWLRTLAITYNNQQMRERAHVHPTARFANRIYLDENVYIGEASGIRSGEVYAGDHSKVVIGKFCAIGNRVSIKARSHNPLRGTTASEIRPSNLRVEEDITIGDYCWIGDNVFINKGVTLGDHCIIGANSVVVKDIPAFSCAGGVPARVLYDRREKGFVPPEEE